MGSSTSSENRVATATTAAAPPSVPIKLHDAPAATATATAAAPSIPQGRKEEVILPPPDPVPMTSVRIHADACPACTGAGECDCGAGLAISTHSFVLESKTALKAKKNECVRRSAHVAMARNTSAVIGSGDACNIQIDDQALLQEHVQLKAGDDGSIQVQPAVSGAKCFVQLGQGSERAAPHILENAQKIKAGALTFQVCAFVKSWASITEGGPGSSAAQTVSDVSSQSTGLDKGGAASGVVHVSASPKPTKIDPDADDDGELVECNRCFICYDSDSGPGLEALIQSPCLCKTMFVHRMCLNQWLEHSPNGRCCMTCKTAFPFGVGVEPPFVVLRITRHMKNLVWKGPKQFVIALRNNEVFTFGSSSSARVQFRDPSVSSRHGQFVYRNDTLYIEDLGSTGGTLLYVDDAYTYKPVGPQIIGGPDVRQPPLIVRAGRSTFKVNTAPDAIEQSVKSGFSVAPVPGGASAEASVETPAGAGAGAGAPADVNFPTAGPEAIIDAA